MIDDEKSIKNPERSGGNSEQIHRRDHVFVISQKSYPAFELVWIGGLKRHVPRHRGLGNLESEFHQFTVDAWRAPTIGCHLANEVTDGGVNSRSTGMPLPRDHSPVATKSIPMPLCHGVRFHNKPVCSSTSARPHAAPPRRHGLHYQG